MLKSKYSFLLLSLLMTNISYAGSADSTKPDIGLNSQKNPFTKNIVASNGIIALPGSLPQGINSISGALPSSSPRGLGNMDEVSEQKTQWDNVKLVGFLNNYVILRLTDPTQTDNKKEPVTVFTELNSKFFLNNNQYSIKQTNKIFTVYNKNNKAVHKLVVGNNAAHIIPRSGGSGASNSTPTISGNSQNGVSGGIGK